MTKLGESHARLLFDLRARQQTFGEEEIIEIAAGGEAFWQWYATRIRCGRAFRLRSVEGIPPYPPPTKGLALWFSGGVESTYTLEQIGHLSPALLHIEDYCLFFGEHRRIGQIHFLCSSLAAALGFGPVYVGVERNDLLLAHNPLSSRYLERSTEFVDAWSRYQPEHPLITVCGVLYKEEIIARLHRRGLRVTGTCDRYRDGRWCGDCYKCFEAFYTAKAVGIDLGIVLRRRAFDAYHGEYLRYLGSNFTDNYNNAYQHYVRLQIMYHLRFEPDRDCEAEPPAST
jgi:hypothetical protein